MPKISLFSKVFDKTPQDNIEFNDYLEGIRSGRWQDKYIAYRSGKLQKKYLPAVTVSGMFSARNNKSLEKHSGIINIDIDSKDNPEHDLILMKAEIAADQYIYGLHTSVSGKGLSVYVKINPSKHYESFLSLEKHFANTYQLIIDKAAKDVPRLRFVSYDPEIYINTKAKKWTELIEKKKIEPRSFNNYIASESDFDFVMKEITSRGVNLADDYNDWMKVGFAIASKFGEAGRRYFHDVSKISIKYDSELCDKKFDNIIKSRNGSVTIKTFFWLAKVNGCQITSPRTQRVLSVSKTRFKQVGKSGGLKSKNEAEISAKKYLREIEGIEGSDVQEIIDQVNELSDYDLNEKTDITQQIETIAQIIAQKNIGYNVITGKLESDGKELSDNDINSIFLDIIEVDKTIGRQLFDATLNSNRTGTFNPFLKFIEDNKHLKPQGNIDKIISCMNDEMTIDGLRVTDYKDIYVRKWMLSIIASLHGTYSLLILVLVGKQMTEKSNWFRLLLPDELRKYYAESKLDAGKDDEILMTQKLLIIDDEFAGKSKQEAKKLKDLSSKQYFSIRRPYGRVTEDINRIAVLGGTSNDGDILNDPTGNRRVIPLNIKSIDRKIYDAVDKKELFIELYHEWKKIGDGWMLTPEEVHFLNKSTNLNQQAMAEEELIQKYYEIDEFGESTTTDIKVLLENKSNQHLNLYRISPALQKLGFKLKAKKINGNVMRVWNAREILVNY